jgi:hypothetical protein
MTEPTSRTNRRMQQVNQDRQREKRRSKLILRGVLLLAVLAIIVQVVVHYWPDPREATLETVAETDSPSWLARIAVENGLPGVAEAAVEKLDDPVLLESIVMNRIGEAAVDAVLKLTQPDALARVALNSPCRETSYIALLQITDQGVLETIALQDSPMSRVAALRLTDKQIARRVFNHADNWQVKLAAARGIDDPELLMIVAQAVNTTNGENYTAVRLLAPHQAELEQVANQAADLYARTTATKLLTDPIARARIVLRGKDYWRGFRHFDRRDLIRTLSDPKALAMVANAKHISSASRCDATERLADQTMLAEIARYNFDRNVREAATSRLTDPAVLRQLAKTKQGIQQRIAIGKIADVEFLKTLQTEHPKNVEQAASKRLEELAIQHNNATWVKHFEKKHAGPDQELVRIALASNYATDAVKRITDPEAIKKVALANNRRNRIAAIKRLDDQKALKRIAKNRNDPWDVRKSAMKRITDQDWLMKLFVWRDPAITTGNGFASTEQKLAVIYCITDQKHLMTIAIDPRCDDERISDNIAWSAAHRVMDPVLAQRVLLESPYQFAKLYGARYTTDPEVLAQSGWKHVRNRQGSWDLFREIAPKLEDRKLLLRMASYSASIGPNAAERRLAELDRPTRSSAK